MTFLQLIYTFCTAAGGAIAIRYLDKLYEFMLKFYAAKSDYRLKDKQAGIAAEESERKGYIVMFNERIAALETERNALHVQMEKQASALQDAENRAVRSESQINFWQMTAQQAQSGVPMLGVIQNFKFGFVLANEKGTIRQISPGITIMLEWENDDLIGNNVLKLIPKEYRDKHNSAWETIRKGTRTPDPDKVIEGEALNKKGRKIPITARVGGWKTEEDGWRFWAIISLTGESVQPISPRAPSSSSIPVMPAVLPTVQLPGQSGQTMILPAPNPEQKPPEMPMR